ncbi:MAG: hypothetical protein RID23_11865 [Roseovarius sp.]
MNRFHTWPIGLAAGLTLPGIDIPWRREPILSGLGVPHPGDVSLAFHGKARPVRPAAGIDHVPCETVIGARGISAVIAVRPTCMRLISPTLETHTSRRLSVRLGPGAFVGREAFVVLKPFAPVAIFVQIPRFRTGIVIGLPVHGPIRNQVFVGNRLLRILYDVTLFIWRVIVPG